MDTRELTACDECCTGCEKRRLGQCDGCIATDGRCQEWSQTGRCPVHACARAHGVQFCGLCDAFPCEALERMIPWNRQIVRHLRTLAEQIKEE